MAFTKEQAKTMSILEVAQSLGMEMKRHSSQEYYWTQHDSLKINIRKNRFNWYSKGIGGDVIKLVETIKEVKFKEAMRFLETGNFSEVVPDTSPKAPFEYRLGAYEEAFVAARDYLKNQRGLSDESIDFFEKQGVLAQARYRNEDGHLEPVVVFKYFDQDKRLVGASLQGIVPDQERHEGKGYLKKILYNSDGLAGMSIDIGQPNRLVFTEAPIDLMSYYELHQDKLENVRLVAMEGLKEQTISRYLMELYAELQGVTDYIPDLTKVGTAMSTAAKTTDFFEQPENANTITLALDNDEAGRKFIAGLDEKGIKVVPDLPPAGKGGQKIDWNEYLKQGKGLALPEQNEYLGKGNMKKGEEPNMRDELKEKSLEETQGIIAETKLGDFPDKQEAAPLPEANVSQPLNDMSPHQTRSQPLLQFTISDQELSIHKNGYHPIRDKELRKLNRYAQNITQVANWYLDNLADTQITYVYTDGKETGQVTVDFGKEHFMHLTGVFPVREGQTAEQTLGDFAKGRLNFDHILIANQGAAFSKLQVLPELQEVLESDAFYFSDLSDVEKLHRLDLDKAIRTADKNLLLALRTVDGTTLPASVMKLKASLNAQIDQSKSEKIILGVYRSRDGVIDQLSINDTYIKDGGREMMAIMEANLKETRLNRYEAIEAERQLDSDGDGISNEDEIRLGTDPHNASSRPGKGKEEQQGERIDEATVSDLLAANDTQGLSQHLREGMRQYLDSDQYKTFLSAMSKFHNYSPQNVALLLAQNPEITAVASYQKWKNDFSRQVQKGERGLKIRVPMTFTLKDENGQPKLDEQGKEVIVTRFKLGTVFDVSQTQGKPLPSPIYNLENDVLDYENLYRAARHVSEQNGVPISFEKIEDFKANGFFDPMNKRIVLADKQMSEAQIMKTLFHEMAHSDIHRHAITESQSDYATGELQAESVAYVVANHYGIDTSDYSFAYLASWARNEQGFEQFEAQLKVVQEEAKSLIDRIDHALVLVKNKTLTQDKFQAKLNQAQTKQESLLLTKEGQEQDLKKSQDMTKNLS